MSLNELSQRLNEMKQKIDAEAKAAFKTEFDAFFAEHPEVLGFTWCQYTPYFNDGDPCTFGVQDIAVVYDVPGAKEALAGGGYPESVNERWEEGLGKPETGATKRRIILTDEAADPQNGKPCWLSGDLYRRWDSAARAYITGSYGPHPETSEQVSNFLVALGKVPDEIFEVLGEGSIVVTRDGVEVRDYEHD